VEGRLGLMHGLGEAQTDAWARIVYLASNFCVFDTRPTKPGNSRHKPGNSRLATFSSLEQTSGDSGQQGPEYPALYPEYPGLAG